MKKVWYIYVFAAIGIIACNNNKHNESENSVNELRQYVDSVKQDRTALANETYWKDLEMNYEEKRQHVEQHASEMSEKQKKDYEQIKADYAQLKMDYEAELAKKNPVHTRRLTLGNTLFGEGVIGEDMNFSFMNGANALHVYETFVTTVDNHRDEYTREDWDEIKVLYEAMDTRKNEVEKEISTKDNNKIALQKIKFVAIKAINRPMAKIEENSEAKDKDKK